MFGVRHALSRPRRLLLALTCLAVLLVYWSSTRAAHAPRDALQLRYLTSVITNGHGQGGRWYIPPQWIDRAKSETSPRHGGALLSPIEPETILEAAQLALELCIRQDRYLKHSKIPLILHQLWIHPTRRDTDPAEWTPLMRERVEDWLEAAVFSTQAPEMAYFLWDDGGLEDMFELLEMDFKPSYNEVPHMIEKADIFRLAILKWFGGVYADTDTIPLRHPFRWIQDHDMEPWKEQISTMRHQVYEPSLPSFHGPPSSSSAYQSILALRGASSPAVGVIVGIECDVPSTSDTYWRAGYTYPLQLTNWAIAMAPQHPLATRYMDTVDEAIQLNVSRLAHVDPLELTGPPRLTKVTMEHCDAEVPGFPWNELSGIDDAVGGRGKVAAGDVLVLPITGFSPGRGRFHNNMGSQPLNHPNALLSHKAEGTWRHPNLMVFLGKACRTLLGRCRDWSKFP